MLMSVSASHRLLLPGLPPTDMFTLSLPFPAPPGWTMHVLEQLDSRLRLYRPLSPMLVGLHRREDSDLLHLPGRLSFRS
jgi:hypothetical protein